MSVFLPFLVVCSIVVETEEVDIYRKRRIIGYLPIKNAVIYTENIKYK